MAQDSTENSQGPEQSSTGYKNDPAISGYDPNESTWTTKWKYITGRMNYDGLMEAHEDAYKRNEKADCKRCEEWRDYNMKYSPTVTFMKKNIEALNGQLDAENVKCARCPSEWVADGTWKQMGGGFNPEHGILICANRLKSKKHLEDTLAHEMVHAWDHLRWKMDAVNDLRHAACTEIRASTLSGECRFARNFFERNNWSITQQFQDCVRKRAILSVMNRPKCKDDVQATKVVNEVWDSCFNDTRPFDEIYK